MSLGSDISRMTKALHWRLFDIGFDVPDDLQIVDVYEEMSSDTVRCVISAGGVKHAVAVQRGAEIAAEHVAELFGFPMKAKVTPELSVVSPIRGGAPLLTDIAGQLRALADQIERGEVTPEAAYAVLVMPDRFEPYFYGWGAVADRHGVAGVFTHVAILALADRNEGRV